MPREGGLRRFKGTQAPKYQYIVDDATQAFSTNGNWTQVTYDSGSPPGPSGLKPPYYHCWKSICHQLDVLTGTLVMLAGAFDAELVKALTAQAADDLQKAQVAVEGQGGCADNREGAGFG